MGERGKKQREIYIEQERMGREGLDPGDVFGWGSSFKE